MSKLLSALANFVLNLVLIPRYGAVGAAVATVVTYGLMVGVNLVIIYQELPLEVVQLTSTAFRVVSVTLVMGAAVFIVLPYVGGILSLIGVILLALAIWSALSVIVGVLDPDHVRSVIS